MKRDIGGPDGPGSQDPIPDPSGDLLADVQLDHFDAHPSTIEPFVETELRWQVTAPEAVAVLLDGEPVDHRGTRIVSPHDTHTYALAAAAGRQSRQLDTVRVSVDRSSCVTSSLANNRLARDVEGLLEADFEGNERIVLQDGTTTAEVRDNGVEVSVPLKVAVPGWVDADVSVDFAVWTEKSEGGLDVRVEADSVDADVKADLLEHIASLGCTGAVQAAMQELMKPMLREYAADEWAPRLQRLLRDEVRQQAQRARDDDPERRQFALIDLELAAGRRGVVQMVFCPA